MRAHFGRATNDVKAFCDPGPRSCLLSRSPCESNATTSPSVTGDQTSPRCAWGALRRRPIDTTSGSVLDATAPSRLPVAGVGHSIGTTALLTLAGRRVWMRRDVRLALDRANREVGALGPVACQRSGGAMRSSPEPATARGEPVRRDGVMTISRVSRICKLARPDARATEHPTSWSASALGVGRPGFRSI